MKQIVVLFILSISSISWSMEQAPRRALMVTIDQENLGVVNYIWDNFRALRIKSMAEGIYEHVYYALGAQCRDDAYMQKLWHDAVADNDIVDYVSFVHGGRQWIKDSWQVPQNSNKLRMVYSEGCGGGDGKEHFIERYKAMVALGHKHNAIHPSASPFFSFRFLQAWLNGASFKHAMEQAWQEGQETLNVRPYFAIAQLVGGYNTLAEALEGSSFAYSHRASIDPNNFTIDTYCLSDSDEYAVLSGTYRDKK